MVDSSTPWRLRCNDDFIALCCLIRGLSSQCGQAQLLGSVVLSLPLLCRWLRLCDRTFLFQTATSLLTTTPRETTAERAQQSPVCHNVVPSKTAPTVHKSKFSKRHFCSQSHTGPPYWYTNKTKKMTTPKHQTGQQRLVHRTSTKDDAHVDDSKHQSSGSSHHHALPGLAREEVSCGCGGE